MFEQSKEIWRSRAASAREGIEDVVRELSDGKSVEDNFRLFLGLDFTLGYEPIRAFLSRGVKFDF